MTINVGVVTSEALVLGCDSVASTTAYLLDPFQKGASTNSDGTMRMDFDLDDLRPTVTNAWDGVTKMFELSTDPRVAAVAAGLAKLNGQTLSSLAAEFASRRKQAPLSPTPETVEAIAMSFLRFMRERYEQHYEDSSLPEELRKGPVFLVGGFSLAEVFPCLYKVDVQRNTCRVQYARGKGGAAWCGQSNAVERLFLGYDERVRANVDATYAKHFQEFRAQVARSVAAAVDEIIEATDHPLMKGWHIHVPEPPALSVPWECEPFDIQCLNLPLQDAIDLTAFLVNVQSAGAKFGSGVATVGGRTHIGVITRFGFAMLNEPGLRHTHTGFIP